MRKTIVLILKPTECSKDLHDPGFQTPVDPMSEKAMLCAAESQEPTQGQATNVIGPDVDAETICLGDSPPAHVNSPDDLVPATETLEPADSQPISFGTPPELFVAENETQQPNDTYETMSNPDELHALNADTFVQGEIPKNELCGSQNPAVPAESEPMDSQPIGSDPPDSPAASPPCPDEDCESEEHASDDEIPGFLTMDGSGYWTQHGQVSGYSLQLMEVVQQLLDNHDASGSSQPAPPQNPGSRATRRAARFERQRKVNKKKGNWGSVVARDKSSKYWSTFVISFSYVELASPRAP